MVQPRVIVVGAGPAGVRCAQALVAAGIRPTVIDEGQRDGGQIYRRQPDNFTRSYATVYGTAATEAEALHRTFDSLRTQIDYLPQTLAWNISERVLYTVHCPHPNPPPAGDKKAARQRTLPFDALILCTGATDRLMPVKGWNFSGAYSLGGAQVALKSQGCAIGRQVAFMGTGALLYLVAAQYVKAGANVAAVLDTSSWQLRVAALPKLLAMPSVLYNGMVLTATLRRAGVPIHTGVQPLQIEGSAHAGVSGLSFRDASGRVHELRCDAVAMGYHLRPETQLADLARCEFYFDEELRQWLPRVDVDGRSSVPGVYLAGDGVRILGANAAEQSGKLAALAVLRDMGKETSTTALAELHASLAKLRQFARGLGQAFPWPAQQAAQLPDDAIVCRCESISAGELRDIVRENGAQEANRAKAFSRVGMGRCQGRYCGHAAAEIIAHAAQVPLQQVGRLRGQAPVKPLPIDLVEETP